MEEFESHDLGPYGFQESELLYGPPDESRLPSTMSLHMSHPAASPSAPHFQHNELRNQQHSQQFDHQRYHDQDQYQQHLELQHQHQPQSQQQQKRTRASGEVLALLVNEFHKNANPSAATRKRISEQTGMPERSVRIWFQNRRAKSRKLEKQQAVSKDPDSWRQFGAGMSDAGEHGLPTLMHPVRYDGIPLSLNSSYFFADARSLTVGSWKRLKSGNLSHENIFSVKSLSNLSPFSINDIMTNSTDLLVIISRKNFEINYFFSAISDSSKTLFRIFYPISAVSNCSLSMSTEEEDDKNCQLRILLNKPPKFAVFLPHMTNTNQWSLCDDFSEAHQVNDAFIGGTGLPHVLIGLEHSLKFVNSFILDFNSASLPQHEFSLPPLNHQNKHLQQQNSADALPLQIHSTNSFELSPNPMLHELTDEVNDHNQEIFDQNENLNPNTMRDDNFENFLTHTLHSPNFSEHSKRDH